jgi:3',5'-cyclic AMP phosphodiesterase CpdA
VHHHLLPVPGTGRERNVVYDAGDAIECLQRAGVHLVLSGHKHVPYAWRLENLFVVTTGTVSSLRLRGNTRPCYNVVEINGSHVSISRRHPFHGEERIIQFSTETYEYEKYTGRIEREVTTRG